MSPKIFATSFLLTAACTKWPRGGAWRQRSGRANKFCTAEAFDGRNCRCGLGNGDGDGDQGGESEENSFELHILLEDERGRL